MYMKKIRAVIFDLDGTLGSQRHRRIAEAIANNSNGDFFIIKSTAEISDVIRGREFFEAITSGQ